MYRMHLQKFRSFLLVLSIITISSQEIFAQITGQITDAITGETLIGVNVIIDGDTNNGSVSDIDGNYSLNAKIGDRVVFSYVGYNDYTIEIDNATGTYNVALESASELIEQFVVVGYGSVQKKDLTGVVAKVGEEDFNRGVVSSPEKLLSGKVAGLQITSNGQPGGGSRIVLRGASSLTAGTSPLIVIDGVPIQVSGAGYNPLNFINPSDVEDITVLKDASASAIYGSRGANGVIIITTKSGKKGGLKVNYTGNGSVSFFNNRTAALTPETYRSAINLKDPGQEPRLGTASTDCRINDKYSKV